MNHLKFDNEQLQAVDHVDGPLLCLAGPGSGKTTVITGRTARLLEKGIKPENILVITFTQFSAREMESRFYKLRPDVPKGKITFSTFHALFFKILRMAYGYSSENIISPERKNSYFKQIIDRLKVDVEDEADYIANLQSEIGIVKAEGMNPERYFPMNLSQEVFLNAYKMYEKMMIDDNLIDFDDMQVLCYELLSKRPDILAGWQRKYKYILVDEAQDTNLLQYKLICMLAAPENNLMLVGDDDQSIYRFRGARPEILLNFPRQFENTKRITLINNYRCAGNIVELSSGMIKDNKNRYDKSLKAANEAAGKITLKEYLDTGTESREILKSINQLHSEGKPFETMAILFRTNLSARTVVEELLRAGIPMNIRDNIPNLYEHWIFRDIKTYIRLAEGERDRASFISIINRPKRYISREAFVDSAVSILRLKRYYSDKPYVQERIDKLSADLNMLKGMRPYAAVHYIRMGIGYEDYIREYAESRGMKAADFIDVVEEIEADASKYNSYAEWFDAAERITAELKAQAEENNKRAFAREGVAIMTYHSSKGLEYDTCFIPSVNEGVIPYKKATNDYEIEEERRMLYVAITRAARNLHISWTRKQYGKDVMPSQFLRKIMIKK